MGEGLDLAMPVHEELIILLQVCRFYADVEAFKSFPS